MKKLFAVVLAVAMVLSLGAVSLAASSTASTQVGTNKRQGGIGAGEDFYVYDEDTGTVVADGNKMTKKAVAYGKTLYIPLLYTNTEDGQSKPTSAVTSADAVSALKVSAKWEENGKYIEDVEIVKKAGAYYIAVETTGSSMDENDVEGTITIKGKAYEAGADYDDKKTKVEDEEGNNYIELDVVITLGYATIGEEGGTISDEIPVDPTIFVFDEDDDMSDEEFDFTCEDDDDVTFTVDTTHQSDIVLSFTTDAIEEVEDKYAAANLEFFVFNGATFKKTGELYIPADEDTYLYEIVDGTATEIDATYDDYEEGFYLKTKTLGTYVVSDIKLATTTAAVVDTDSTSTATTTNPATGAAL